MSQMDRLAFRNENIGGLTEWINGGVKEYCDTVRDEVAGGARVEEGADAAVAVLNWNNRGWL